MTSKSTDHGDLPLEIRVQPGSSDANVDGSPAGSNDCVSDVLHLAELVGMVRRRFAIAQSFPDDAILASLKTIAAQSDTNARIATAFMSNLGQHLERGRPDQRTAIVTLVGLLPPPRS